MISDCPSVFLEQNNEHSIFEKAIFEHNLFSLSRLYDNISFDTISHFLNIDEEKVIIYSLDIILYIQNDTW